MKFLLLFATSVFLVACGGGGGGAGSAPAATTTPVASTSTFQLKQAYINDFTSTGTIPFTISAVITNAQGGTDTAKGSGTETRTPVVAGTFVVAGPPGIPSLQKSITVSGTATYTSSAGVNTPVTLSAASIGHVKPDGSYDALGSSDPTSVRFWQGNKAFTLPLTAKVGDSGPFFETIERFGFGSTNAAIAFNFALEADTTTTAMLKITQTRTDTLNKLTAIRTNLYRITPVGAISPISSVLQSFNTSNGAVTNTETVVY